MEHINALTPLLVALFTLVGTWISQHYAAKGRLREEQEKNRQKLELEKEKHDKQIRLLTEALQEQSDSHTREIDSLKDGTRALIRNDILDICRDAIKKQYIDIYTLETLNGLYDSYKVFLGNSTVEDLYLEVKSLPILDERDIII